MTENDPSGGATSPLDFDPPSAEELTSILEGYEVLAFLAKGYLGTVYKASQPHLDRLVALKILPAQTDTGTRFIERFQREAQTMAKLRHDHIMTVHDFGETTDGKYIFIAMEWVEGNTLERAILQENFSQRHILAIVTQICDALQYAHEHGVIHRDIKPANIMLDVNGKVKIADFGLAQIVGTETHDNKLTHSTASIGLPDFVAPEQLEPGHAIDHRADIYSIGVILYKMLTGYTPRGTFLPPSRKIEGLDPRLDEIVAKAMAADPENRYPQISQMWQDVETVHTQPITAAQSQPQLITGIVEREALPEPPLPPATPAATPVEETAAPAPTSDKAVAITVMALVGSFALIFAIVAVGWFMSRGDSTETENEPPVVSVPQRESAGPRPEVADNPPRRSEGKAQSTRTQSEGDQSEKRVVSIRRDSPDPTPPPVPPEKTTPSPEPDPSLSVVSSPAPATPPVVEPQPAPPATEPVSPPPTENTPTPEPDTPLADSENPTAPILATFRERYEESIGAAHRTEVAVLDTQYLAAIGRAEKVASDAGNLDDVIALRNETAAIDDAAGGSASLADLPAGAPQSLQDLRATYTDQRAKLEGARDADAVPLLAAYDKALEKLQGELTRSMKIDDAVAVRTAREQLRKESPFTPGANGLDAPLIGEAIPAGTTPASASARPKTLEPLAYPPQRATTTGGIAGWDLAGNNLQDYPQELMSLRDIVDFDSGVQFGAALRSDGTVVTWYFGDPKKRRAVPEGLADVVDVATNDSSVIAVLGDGTVVAWSKSNDAEVGVPDRLRNVSAVTAGTELKIALRRNGSLKLWGRWLNPKSVEAAEKIYQLVKVEPGAGYALGLQEDGKVKILFDEAQEGKNLSNDVHRMVEDLKGVIDIAVNVRGRQSLAVLNTGEVVAWGWGTAEDPDANPLPSDLPKDIDKVVVGRGRADKGMGAAHSLSKDWIFFGAGVNADKHAARAAGCTDIQFGWDHIWGLRP